MKTREIVSFLRSEAGKSEGKQAAAFEMAADRLEAQDGKVVNVRQIIRATDELPVSTQRAASALLAIKSKIDIPLFD